MINVVSASVILLDGMENTLTSDLTAVCTQTHTLSLFHTDTHT